MQLTLRIIRIYLVLLMILCLEVKLQRELLLMESTRKL